MPDIKDPLPLDYATPAHRSIPGFVVKLNTTSIIVMIIGGLLIALGILDQHYAVLSLGGCVLVGSGLISLSITNALRRQPFNRE